MENKPLTILTIDDEDAVRWSFASFLEDYGYQVLQAENGRIGLETFRRHNPDLVMVDLRMPEVDGLEVLSTLSKESPETPLIVVSGAGVARDAVNALKMGAWDYIFKPVENLSILIHTVQRTLERARLRKDNRQYQENLEALVAKRSEQILEYSRRLKHLADCTRRFAACKTLRNLCPVLLKALGENTGAAFGGLYLLENGKFVLKSSMGGQAMPPGMPGDAPGNPLAEKLRAGGEGFLCGRLWDQDKMLDLQGGIPDGDACLALPLKDAQGELKGKVLLGGKDFPPFSSQDLELCGLLASHGMEAYRDILAARALRESEERFRALTENTSDVTLILDENQVYTYASPSVKAVYGIEPEGLVGRTPGDHVHPDDLPAVMEVINQSHNHPGQSIALPGVRTRRPDGSWFWIEGLLSNQLNVAGVRGTVFCGRDITHRRQAEQELRLAYRQLEENNRQLENAGKLLEDKANALELSNTYKSQFLANVSHELRTPLNSIILLSGILMENKGGRLNESDLECANAVHFSGKSLLTLINEVLDLSKVEAGKMEVQVAPVSLLDFAQSLEWDFAPLAREKDLKFSVLVDDNCPGIIQSDGQKIGHIMRNFISNALKFTKKGRVSVRMGRASGAPGGRKPPQGFASGAAVFFSVEDSGIGIEPDKIEEVFEAFTQADGTTSREYGGTGLGLTISREFARLIGGEIEVDSQLGKGSLFILWLPESHEPPGATPVVKPWMFRPETQAAQGSPLGGSRMESISPSKALSGKCILVTDADMRNVFMIRKMLSESGSKVLVARSEKEAMERLRDNPDVDIIMADAPMLGLDGIAGLCKGPPALPVIALSGQADPGECARLYKAGACACLPKPLDGNLLFSTLEACLKKQ